MHTIWKYEFEVIDERQSKEMPENAVLLYVAEQNGRVCLWARVNSVNKAENRQFRVVGTGHPIEGWEDYVGSVQMPPFVWHLVERTR